jgi:hypothetical protein
LFLTYLLARLVSLSEIAVPVKRARIARAEKTSNLISTEIPGMIKSVKLLNIVSAVIAARRIAIRACSLIALIRSTYLTSQLICGILKIKFIYGFSVILSHLTLEVFI